MYKSVHTRWTAMSADQRQEAVCWAGGTVGALVGAQCVSRFILDKERRRVRDNGPSYEKINKGEFVLFTTLGGAVGGLAGSVCAYCPLVLPPVVLTAWFVSNRAQKLQRLHNKEKWLAKVRNNNKSDTSNKSDDEYDDWCDYY
jgi:hypothetical protein